MELTATHLPSLEYSPQVTTATNGFFSISKILQYNQAVPIILNNEFLNTKNGVNSQ